MWARTLRRCKRTPGVRRSGYLEPPGDEGEPHREVWERERDRPTCVDRLVSEWSSTESLHSAILTSNRCLLDCAACASTPGISRLIDSAVIPGYPRPNQITVDRSRHRRLAGREPVLRTPLALTLSAALALPVFGMAAPAAAAPLVEEPASLVNTFIGSQNEGNTFPGASTPFGMVQISPDTLRANNDDDEWSHTGYNYDHTRIRGFSQLHPSGVGCSLGGQLPLMPTTGALDSTQAGDNA